MTHSEFLELLKKEMVPAMGCTEPAAAALAGAGAKELLKDYPVEKVVVRASRNMIKNAMGVGLPNCEQKGILMAVALGIVKGRTDRNLNILSNVTDEDIKQAQKIKLELILAEKVPQLYVSVELWGEGHKATAVISGEHNRFTYCAEVQKTDLSALLNVSIRDIKEFADGAKAEELTFINKILSVVVGGNPLPLGGGRSLVNS